MKITKSHTLAQMFGGKLTTMFAAEVVRAVEKTGNSVDEYEGVDLSAIRDYIALDDAYMLLLKSAGKFYENDLLWTTIHALKREIKAIGDTAC